MNEACDPLRVEPHAERGRRIRHQQVVAHPTGGHRPVLAHERGDRVAMERRLVSAPARPTSLPSPFAITARSYPAVVQRVAERADLRAERAVAVGGDRLADPEVDHARRPPGRPVRRVKTCPARFGPERLVRRSKPAPSGSSPDRFAVGTDADGLVARAERHVAAREVRPELRRRLDRLAIAA